MVDAAGSLIRQEQIPGTCDGISRKLLAIAVDSTNTVHIALGKDNIGSSLIYYERLDSGTWTVIGESIPTIGANLGDVSIAVTTLGTVMVAYKDLGISNNGYEIRAAATRNAAFKWTIDDISAACCFTAPMSLRPTCLCSTRPLTAVYVLPGPTVAVAPMILTFTIGSGIPAPAGSERR